MRIDKPCHVIRIAVLIALVAGCATPATVKTSSQEQLKGYQELKRQIHEFHRQIDQLLRTYTRLNLEGTQHELVLAEVDALVEERIALDQADDKLAESREQAAEELQDLFKELEQNLKFLKDNRDAALKEVDNLIAIHSLINDYLGIDLTVSSQDMQHIFSGIKELSGSEEGS